MSLDQLRQVRAVQRLCYLSMSLLVLVVLLNPFNPASRLLQCEINFVSSQADSNPCWRKSLYITWPNLPSLDSSKTHFIWSIYPRKKMVHQSFSELIHTFLASILAVCNHVLCGCNNPSIGNQSVYLQVQMKGFDSHWFSFVCPPKHHFGFSNGWLTPLSAVFELRTSCETKVKINMFVGSTNPIVWL